MRQAQLLSGCITMVFWNSVIHLGKIVPVTPGSARILPLYPRRQCFSVAQLKNGGHAGWDVIWSSCFTDWTWRYMGFGQDGAHLTPWKAIRICVLFLKEPRNLLSQSHVCQKSSVDGCHNGHGRFNTDSTREDQVRRTRHTAPLQKKNVQTTKKSPT
jgi:hypothetical protein